VLYDQLAGAAGCPLNFNALKIIWKLTIYQSGKARTIRNDFKVGNSITGASGYGMY
jgi:hypothetical protein